MKKTHQPCPDCGSSDALTIYENGGTHCFSCSKTKKGDGIEEENKIENKNKSIKLIECQTATLSARKIDNNTCKVYDYRIGKHNNKDVQIRNYRNSSGEIIAQKVRDADKNFRWVGNSKEVTLYGSHLYKQGGKTLVITEGEIDALSIGQCFFNKKPVVSIPNGRASRVKDIKKNFEYVNSFKEIVLCFDNDEAGRNRIEEVVFLFEPGKIKVVNFPEGYKDANELLQEDKVEIIAESIHNAQLYRPDSIINSMEIDLEMLLEPMEGGVPFRYPMLNEMTMGVRPCELVIWTAGSGIGKSTQVREVRYDYITKHNKKVGMIFLEEQYKKTAQAFISIDNNVPLKDFRKDPNIIKKNDIENSFNKLFKSGNVEFYNHFGSLDAQNLISKMRYMRVSLGVDVIFLDHISIVVSGSRLNDERKEIDIIMTELKSLREQTGLIIHRIVHLKRKDSGKSFNEGRSVSLTDLRGSASLEQLSDMVIRLERDQQSEEESNHLQLRVLKRRETGDTGKADKLVYNKDTGRIELDGMLFDDEVEDPRF